MQASTGQTFTLDDPRVKNIPAHDLVLLSGTPEAIEAVSHRARLGAQELARREKRRKQQKASRRANR